METTPMVAVGWRIVRTGLALVADLKVAIHHTIGWLWEHDPERRAEYLSPSAHRYWMTRTRRERIVQGKEAA